MRVRIVLAHGGGDRRQIGGADELDLRQSLSTRQ
jgi:hypothetical protein